MQGPLVGVVGAKDLFLEVGFYMYVYAVRFIRLVYMKLKPGFVDMVARISLNTATGRVVSQSGSSTGSCDL